METNRTLLAHDWRFALTEDEQAIAAAYDDSQWRTITLPHDWQIEQPRRPDAPGGGPQGYFPREQMGVYRLRFFAPESLRGKVVRVLFDGVQRFSTVYLNGQAVGGRPYGYVPFLCDLSNALILGEENLLAVRVDNRDVDGSRTAGGDRWYSGAGIYRDAWLLVDEPVRIAHDGVRVVAEPVLRGPSGDVPDVAGIQCAEARVSVRVEIEGACAGLSVRVALSDAAGDCLCEAVQPAAALTEFALTLPRPSLWSPQTPTLYTARVTLADQAPHLVRFGVRSAVFDSEEGFLLNGVQTKLWGVNLHHDGGAVGAAVPIQVWRRRLQAVKALGANTVRASHNPMAEAVYDLCDELGLMVIDELYDKWSQSGMYYDRLFDDWHLSDAEAMVRRDANHPSIILWSVGNEVNHQYSELFYESLKNLCAQVRRLDPTRALTTALIGFVIADFHDQTPLGKKIEAAKRYAELVDVFSGNYMEQYYEKLREAGMRKPILGTEVRLYYRHDDRYMNSAQVSLDSPYEVVHRHSWVCGAILWAGVDYLGEAGEWPHRGWTGNPMDTTGDWRLRAWHCAAQFKSEPILKLCVYDESEPWDGARGMWGFPQMRAHWRYNQLEKVLHVCAMTNCDTVRLYQNSQTVRVAHLKEFPDGMVHFWLPYIPGVLRAEGYRSGIKVCEDALHSDHTAESLRVTMDCAALPADGRSAAMIDLYLEDKHGARFALENRRVRVTAEGAPVRILLDNGDPYATEPFDSPECLTFNGHLLVLVQAGRTPGQVKLRLETEGFAPRELTLLLEG
ncbi:MAG: DUF4982 domain-containing protein [Oscillospiraceae bacterium]|jgi:beta-galactosidase|nr:DUF4982 domain-containing protein [Oscillospiraceae bacterium]